MFIKKNTRSYIKIRGRILKYERKIKKKILYRIYAIRNHITAIYNT